MHARRPVHDGHLHPGGSVRHGAATRITFGLGKERTAAWLPDGSGIVYSFEREDRRDRDHCLGRLPPLGGTLTRVDCVTAAAADDSIDVLEYPAISADGRIAYVLSSASLFPARPIGPDVRALVVAPLDQPLAVRVLQPIIYFAPSGKAHKMISSLHWLDASRLVYVGDDVVYRLVCVGCQVRDTLERGLEIVTLDLSGPTPVLAVVPGTDEASSVAVGASPDTIYWTKNGDARVYRTALSSGQTGVAFDFGAAGIARDVSVVGSKLVAVVGGRVRSYVDLVYGPLQPDTGGFLHLVDLSAGTDTTLGDSTLLFRRPALSPSGNRLVAEAVALSLLSDLWLLDAP